MPLTRYQIRNEYGLADPELYRAADKDDPEALLEGVALAGLVGLLRQLGDLSEFAAQIFHDLHEEVMATASRGHGLMLRVQQLEAEVPSIENAFLTQTSHSQFLLNTGVDWHPNMRMDENLITREDLPRCVMGSYEECRGPPRLFLLDKFDVAGAGACLKRYSDPSFFKMEFTSSETMEADIQREKKARKFKKKGSRWRNGENLDFNPTSHSKLHQLLSEERNSDNNSLVQRVKLKKRQLSGFPSDSTIGKSYMERFVETNSPERRISCENSLVLPQLNTESSNMCENGLEIHEISTGSPASKLMWRERGPYSSDERQEAGLDQSMYDLHEDVGKEGIIEKLHEPVCDIEVGKHPSSLYKLEDQKELMVDVENHKEASDDGYRSDDITSEVDSYLDALPTMESEMETDTDRRLNNDQGFSNINKLGMDSDTKEEQQKHQDRFSDSHSSGNSIESDNMLKNGRYSPGHDVVSEVATSAGTCTTEMMTVSSRKPSANDYTLVSESLEYVDPSGSCIEISEIASSGSEVAEASPDSCVTDSTSTASYHLIRGADLNEFQLQGSESVANGGPSSNTEEDTENLVNDVPCTTNISDFASKMKDGTLAEEFEKNRLVEVIDDVTHELSSDASLHQSDVSGLVVGTNYNTEDARTDNIKRNNDLQHSVTLATEKQLSGLERLDVEVCSINKLPECLQAAADTDDLDDMISDRSLVTEIPEYVASEEVPPQMYFEVGSGGSWVKSLYNDLELSHNTPDDGIVDEPTLDVVQSNSGGSVGKGSSSGEFPTINFTADSRKAASMTNNSLQMDGFTGINHTEAVADSVMCQKPIASSNYIKQEGECPPGSRNGDGLQSEIYTQLDNMESLGVNAEADDGDASISKHLIGSPARNHLELEDKCPANNGNVDDIENEVNPMLDNLITETAHAEADASDTADHPNQIGSSSKIMIKMKLHEEFLNYAGSEQCKLDTAGTPNPEFINREDAQNETNQPAAASLNLDAQVYSSESHGPASSEFPYDIHVLVPIRHPEGHLHPMDIAEVPKSSEEIDKQFQFAHQIQPSESAEDPNCDSLSNLKLRTSSEQAPILESHQLIVESLDGERDSRLLSNLLDDETESLKGRDQNCYQSFPSKTSWFEETEHIKHRDPDGSSYGATEFSCIGPYKQSLGFLSVPTSPNMLTFKPTIEPFTSSFPSSGMSSGAGHEQSSKRQTLQEPNVAHADLEAPPLPPLPPLQWRVGKFQHSSVTAEGEKVQTSPNPFSPQGFTPLGGDNVQPVNSFLLQNSRGGRPGHGSKASWEDMLHLDLKPLSSQLPAVVGDADDMEGSQTSEVQDSQLLNPFLPLPATGDEEHGPDLLPLVEEKVQPSLNSVSAAPATEEVRFPDDALQESCDLQNLREPESNIKDGSLKDEEPLKSSAPPIIKKVQSLNSFVPLFIKEKECLNSVAPSTVKEEESLDSIAPPITKEEESLNSFAPATIEEKESQNSSVPPTVKGWESLNSFTPPIIKEEESLNSIIPATAEEKEPLNSIAPPILEEEESLNSFAPPTVKEPLNSSAPPTVKEEESLNSFATPTVKEEPLNSTTPPIIKEEVSLNSSALPIIEEEEAVNSIAAAIIKEKKSLNSFTSNIKHEESADSSFTLEGEMPSNASTLFPSTEVGVPNGKPPKKQPRPRDPLIEAVASHDRSTLRKVTERARPQTEHKMDERVSMLEQIRAKSFNLKPAARPVLTMRPSIQGPRTNLKVAAILEKANAIRQATAGSDEDDDRWSDC